MFELSHQGWSAGDAAAYLNELEKLVERVSSEIFRSQQTLEDKSDMGGQETC